MANGRLLLLALGNLADPLLKSLSVNCISAGMVLFLEHIFCFKFKCRPHEFSPTLHSLPDFKKFGGILQENFVSVFGFGPADSPLLNSKTFFSSLLFIFQKFSQRNFLLGRRSFPSTLRFVPLAGSKVSGPCCLIFLTG